LHGARAEEELRADLRVRVPVARELRDLRLLGGELAAGVVRSLARLLAGGDQLSSGALRERLHADCAEHVVRGMEMLTRVDASALAAQPLPVQEVCARQRRCEATAAEPVERLTVELLGRCALAEQRARARLEPERHVGPGCLR